MKTIKLFSIKLTLVLLLVVALFGSGLSPAQTAAAACAPTVTVDLWAKTGTATLYSGATVNIWGYSNTSGGAASLPGPVFTANQGDCVSVTLHNTLTEASALVFQGQSMVPDTTGAPANGGSKQYIFTATNPGTFLYEAGLIPHSQHQVAMGLYGAFIVRPTATVPAGFAGQAYANATTAYNVEAPVVLSEFDPAVAANPGGFDMRNYAPKYFLINGKAYPNAVYADSVSFFAAAGNVVLFRYVNAGLQSHAMSLLGLSQKAIATDGQPYAHAHTMVAETIAPGQTLDALVTIPATTPPGSRFALYDANLMLRNANSAGLGGMLTFLKEGTPPPPPSGDTTGPATSGVALSPNPTNGSSSVNVSATVSDAATGGSNVAAAEFYIDSTAGSPTAMSGAFSSPTVSVAGSIPTSTLSALASGNHTIYVRGQDAVGNWGPFSSAVLNLDKAGPITSALVLSPNPTNGSAAVALTASASDSSTGNNNITAAQYTIDGGAPSSMTVNQVAPTASLSASIPAATVNALAAGNHTIAVRSQDALGNWGAVANITLSVDKAAPTTSNLSASPNPNNGSMGLNTSTPAVRVTASFSDAASGNSNIAAAEGFLDTIGTTGTGYVFIATDGNFNSPSEPGYADIPLAVIGALTQGNHTIYVHARDAAGNWGAMSTTVLVIDKNLIFMSTFTNAVSPFGWSSVGGTAGRLSVISAANMKDAGTYGLAAVISGGTSGYVQDNTPANETRYNARFYFNPNGWTTGSGGNPPAITIFSGLNSTGTTIFQVQYRRSTNTGYQVRLTVTRSGGTTSTSYYTINNAANSIEIAWQSGSSASASLYIGGTLRQTLTGLNTSAYTLDTVRLGPQGTGLPSGTVYFDGFYSTRNGAYIGP